MFTNRDAQILREAAYNKALDDVLIQCNEYVEMLEAHSDPDGNMTGPDFNMCEIGAVRDIMARVEKMRVK